MRVKQALRCRRAPGALGRGRRSRTAERDHGLEAFRPDLAKAVLRPDGSKGGRPPFDHVFMFKILIVVRTIGIARADLAPSPLVRNCAGV